MLSRRTFLYASSSAAFAGGSVARLDGTRLAPDAIEREVSRLMKAAGIPGLCVAVLNQGRTVYLHGFGLRNIEESKPMTVDTIMYGASFTKAAFAYMVMQLVDETVLNLDRPLNGYLPKPLAQYEKYSDLANYESYKKITPRMLLAHTAGFPNFRFLNSDQKLDIKFEPGTRYAYSGEGINLLGFVIEVVTGKSIGDLMKTRVFDKLRMTRTSMTWQPEFESNHGVGYDEQLRPLGHNRRQNPRAAGSMDTTISDYAKFIEAVLQRRGLSAKSWDTMLSPQIRIHSKQQFPTLLPEIPGLHDKIQLSYGLDWASSSQRMEGPISKKGTTMGGRITRYALTAIGLE
ncbi:MAG: serine hydrolase domain-containing protein [Bryobacteraceae bacterium]